MPALCFLKAMSDPERKRRKCSQEEEGSQGSSEATPTSPANSEVALQTKLQSLRTRLRRQMRKLGACQKKKKQKKSIKSCGSTPPKPRMDSSSTEREKRERRGCQIDSTQQPVEKQEVKVKEEETDESVVEGSGDLQGEPSQPPGVSHSAVTPATAEPEAASSSSVQSHGEEPSQPPGVWHCAVTPVTAEPEAALSSSVQSHGAQQRSQLDKQNFSSTRLLSQGADHAAQNANPAVSDVTLNQTHVAAAQHETRRRMCKDGVVREFLVYKPGPLSKREWERTVLKKHRGRGGQQ